MRLLLVLLLKFLKKSCSVFFLQNGILFLPVFFANDASAQIIHLHQIHCKIDQTDTKTFRQIARYEAQLYNAVFETQKNDSLTLNINIYGREKDFKLTPDGENTLRASANGYTMANSNNVYIIKNEYVNSVLLHEISHVFLHYNMPDPPKWFDEGMATYCGSLIVENDKIYYVPIAGRIARINELKDDKTLNLKAFLENKTVNWGNDREQISDHYTIAYGIIYFLVSINLNFIKYLAVELNKGRPATTILADLFAGRFDFFEQRFNEFYQKQK